MQATILPIHANDLRDATHTSRRSQRLAALARQALIAEAELTPKPGLVDRRGSGAHYDLSLETMTRSAATLEPYFGLMASASAASGLHAGLRAELAAIGRDAERAMYRVTRGSNSHKGAIWILGLLVSASARVVGHNAREIAAMAGAIARLPDRAQPEPITHGQLVKDLYGASGARGEAYSDFPHVVNFGLATLRERRQARLPEEVCRLDALLSVMSDLDDTCVLYRGGIGPLNLVKSGARTILMAGGCGTAEGLERLLELDRELITRHVSPGGSADLLAATLFLDAIEEKRTEVRADLCMWEERYGTA